MTNQFIDKASAKNPEYRQLLDRIAQTTTCPFCPEGIPTAELNPILKEGKYWHLRACRFPYPNSTIHLLLILTRHAEDFLELSADEEREGLEILKWAKGEYRIPGGAIFLRFGDTRFTGASVRHLHWHLIVPELDPELNRAKVVTFPIG